MKQDAIYTPRELASELAAFADLPNIRIIADFTCGDGRLLDAAQARYPRARLIGADIDERRIEDLRARTHWEVAKTNFVSRRSRNASAALRNVKGRVDLVLLNPPFSFRGNRTYPILIGGRVIRCSPAMAFVLTTLEYVKSRNGQIVCILPAGTIQNCNDKDAWSYISSRASVEVLRFKDKYTFCRCTPRTVLVRITTKAPGRMAVVVPLPQQVTRGHPVIVSRGNVSMPQFKRRSGRACLPIVHTTELHDNDVNLLKTSYVSRKYRRFTGPVVLLPRVGRPDARKIVLYTSKREIVLSNCVLAIRAETIQTARAVYRALTRNSEEFERSFHGTCAQFLTVGDLFHLLEKLGFLPAIDQRVRLTNIAKPKKHLLSRTIALTTQIVPVSRIPNAA